MAAKSGTRRNRGPDHRDKFSGRQFIDQRSVGSCHSCSLAELYSVIAKQSISPVQHFLDWWGHEGADMVMAKNLDFINKHKEVGVKDVANEMHHLFLHGGHAVYDLQLLQQMGCQLDPNNSDSFEHIEEIFKRLFQKREELINREEPITQEEMAGELLDGGLNELFSLAFNPNHNDQRMEVAKLAREYEMDVITLNGYTKSHYSEIKQAILAILQDAPVVANIGVQSGQEVGHAVVLVGYSPYDDSFYYKDSASQKGFQKVDAGFFIGRIRDICRLKPKETSPSEPKQAPASPLVTSFV